jgi:SAM-dependent methyltransferase
MSFTGERYIPGEGGCQIAYEHLHRYFFALRWAENSEVLDLACGNGYGSALLARRARHVWGLDIDDDTIKGASKGWRNSNLTFIQGNATQLPFRSGSMDVIVAMEALEHIKDQTQLLREIARVCGSNGVLLISTPNKAEYSDARNYANPFHVRELYLDEFRHLLQQHFPCVEIAGQQILAGSLITGNRVESSNEIFEEPVQGREDVAGKPMYYLAVCSSGKLPKPVPAHSAYLDASDGLIREIREESAQEIDKLNEEIRTLGQWAKNLEGVVEERDQTLRDMQEEMKSQVNLRDQAIRNLQQEMLLEIAERDQRISRLVDLLHQKEKEFDDRGKWALSLQAEVERLARIRKVLLYRILSRLGLLPK